ncbi:rho GTPase-activating protein 10 isoform X2 [Bicyclus anynana]|uniref:Rho GTPase-activating protein 10 isoform X2 n=1 Tax=Bicyclus anynana TaxID=110368 RepID=A0ABM3LZS6_BICAN|nr:rho GTPase-activating protein 10 isoform X2 [Bicyclus anynana]
MEQFEFACIGASTTEDERVIGRSLHHFAQLIRTVEDERERMVSVVLRRAECGERHGAVRVRVHRRLHHGGRASDRPLAAPLRAAHPHRRGRARAHAGARARADHPAAGALPQGPHRSRQGGQEEVRQEDGQVLPEPGAHAVAVQQEARGGVPGGRRRHGHGGARLLPGVAGVRVPAAGRAGAQEVRAGGDAAGLRVRLVDLPPHGARRARRRRAAGARPAAAHPADAEQLRGDQQADGVAHEEDDGEAFGTTWSKHYCTYEAPARALTLLPYSQLTVRAGAAERVPLAGARAAPDAERRFCWEAAPAERERAPLTLQALGERDRALWLRAADALAPPARAPPPAAPDLWPLDDAGFAFVRRLAGELEARGLDEQGLYRVAGVASKVARLVALGRARRLPALAPAEWESKTLASALKAYLRALPEPLLTRALHGAWLAAARGERAARARALHALVRALPPRPRDMLRLLLAHLARVARRADRNLMTAANLAVCFGPTLLRAERETVASILELKFYNVVVESLLDNFPAVFAAEPPPAEPPDAPPAPPAAPPAAHNGGPSASATSAACAAYAAPHAQLLAQLARGASSSASSASASPPPPPPAARVRTLYACVGESEGELSFEPNQIITDVSASGEPGWLRGSLDGRSGLVPMNYVEPLP